MFVDCLETVEEEVVSITEWADEVWEEVTSTDEGEIVGVTVTVAGPVAVIVISRAYVVGSP